ncbi:MAG: ankyrin repeat domain-containing protein [Cytophagales bacterium]
MKSLTRFLFPYLDKCIFTCNENANLQSTKNKKGGYLGTAFLPDGSTNKWVASYWSTTRSTWPPDKFSTSINTNKSLRETPPCNAITSHWEGHYLFGYAMVTLVLIILVKKTLFPTWANCKEVDQELDKLWEKNHTNAKNKNTCQNSPNHWNHRYDFDQTILFDLIDKNSRYGHRLAKAIVKHKINLLQRGSKFLKGIFAKEADLATYQQRITFLLENGFKINAIAANGWTLLQMVVSKKWDDFRDYEQMVSFLLAQGASASKDVLNSLFCSVIAETNPENREESFKVISLIKKNSTVDMSPCLLEIMDRFIPSTAEISSTEEISNVENTLKNLYLLVDFLLQSSCVPSHISTTNGDPILHFLVRYNQPDLLTCFLKHGADLSKKDVLGRTCLHEAIIFGTPAIVKILCNSSLEKQLDPPLDQITNKENRTPLEELNEKFPQNSFSYKAKKEEEIRKMLQQAAKREEIT